MMNPRLTYRESAVAGASPVRQVILLYEQAIEDLRRALAACSGGEIERRTRQINHAILILGCLQSSLNRERGGAVAGNLDRFYNQVRTGLLDAQCRQSAAEIERQIALLVEVHEAWCEVERREVERVQIASGAPPETVPISARATGDKNMDPTPMPAESIARSSAEWNA
jgi:flagellar secretion chaperone FliS